MLSIRAIKYSPLISPHNKLFTYLSLEFCITNHPNVHRTDPKLRDSKNVLESKTLTVININCLTLPLTLMS